METHTLFRKKFNSYLLEFDEIKDYNASNVLMWFYKFKDAIVMFDIGEISDFVYNRLKNSGYDEIHDINDERNILFSLNNEDEANKDVIARKILAIILRRLKEHNGLDLVIVSLIEIYNEKFNREIVLKYMMKSLHDSIGSRITFNAIKNGEFLLVTGELNEVEDYKTITVDGVKYSFVELNFGIIKIANDKGCVIYNNSSLNTSINLGNSVVVKKLNQELFDNNDGQEIVKSI